MTVPNQSFKIAFLSAANTVNRRTWSGSPYYMAQALERQGCEVTHLGPAGFFPWKLAGKIANKGAQWLLGKNYDWMDSVWLARRYAKIFGRKLAGRKFDFIVAPAARAEIAFLETNIPIAYAADATFQAVTNYYPGFSRLLKISTRAGNAVEQTAIQRASILAFASDWAARSAINDYQADPAKTSIIPFGANLDEIPPPETALQKRKSGRCRLLFLGVNWKRKGGGIAFNALLALEKMGFSAELIVCGCHPPRGVSHKNMTVIPFLDKNDPNERRKLGELFFSSGFLLLPTRNECYGVVFCEAAAFGLPVIATATGGVPTIVREGENGHLLPPEAGGEEYARLIAEIYRDDERYYNLVRASRKAFEERLNWDVWAATVLKLAREKLVT